MSINRFVNAFEVPENKDSTVFAEKDSYIYLNNTYSNIKQQHTEGSEQSLKLQSNENSEIEFHVQDAADNYLSFRHIHLY